jgi:LPXTG-motif cell wall-anchored protein
VSSSTIAGNEAPLGSGLFAESSSLTVTLRNSVLADNDVDDLTLDAATLDASYSLVERPTATLTETGNLTGIDPRLGALANNGGTTLTMLPLAGSPLINAGNPATTGIPATDQRGLARISGPRIDMGAVEVQAVLAATGSNDPTAPILGGALLAFAGLLLLVVRRRRTA